jgi:hypothetical protein
VSDPAAMWWIVIGRFHGDDEDTLETVRATTREEAIRAFGVAMNEVRSWDRDKQETEGKPTIYINYVVFCGFTKPRLIY